MDRSIVLSLVGLLLIIAVLVNTFYFDEIAKKWLVDPTASLVNTGAGSIKNIIKPPETRVIAYEDKSIILLDNMSSEEEGALLTEPGFRNALASQDRLLLYTSRNGWSAVAASNYFNGVEVEMLSADKKILNALGSHHLPGMINLSGVDASDPTNAKVEMVEVGGRWVSLLASHEVSNDNFSVMASSDEFDNAIGDSSKLRGKTLVLYRPSKSNVNIIIPVNFRDDEIRLLAKNSAVKTALDVMDVKRGETLDLEGTPEFKQVDMAKLPYQPNTRIYVSFNIKGELGFLSEDMVIYLAVAIVILVVLYVLYTILVD
ncbi:hypothetical protein H0N98_01115 [Candidatus Micrarchaeota archaeon]|nr:hypothetical protein [Candidatus Micrarchaeota archaeon]